MLLTTQGLQHDNPIVTYTEGGTRAMHFDGELHVIRYSPLSVNHVVFESDGTQPRPKYRLSCWLDRGSLNGKSEIAAPASE